MPYRQRFQIKTLLLFWEKRLCHSHHAHSSCGSKSFSYTLSAPLPNTPAPYLPPPAGPDVPSFPLLPRYENTETHLHFYLCLFRTVYLTHFLILGLPMTCVLKNSVFHFIIWCHICDTQLEFWLFVHFRVKQTSPNEQSWANSAFHLIIWCHVWIMTFCTFSREATKVSGWALLLAH